MLISRVCRAQKSGGRDFWNVTVGIACKLIVRGTIDVYISAEEEEFIDTIGSYDMIMLIPWKSKWELF